MFINRRVPHVDLKDDRHGYFVDYDFFSVVFTNLSKTVKPAKMRKFKYF